MTWTERLKAEYRRRPVWMNLIFLFCIYMTVFYMPFDLFWKPVADDQEVWFGFMLTGWAAKATEPLHWAIYGAGAWGFLHMRRWMFPWAAVYTAQVAAGMLIWTILADRGPGPVAGLVAALPFVVLVVLLLRARDQFNGVGAVEAVPDGETLDTQ